MEVFIVVMEVAQMAMDKSGNYGTNPNNVIAVKVWAESVDEALTAAVASLTHNRDQVSFIRSIGVTSPLHYASTRPEIYPTPNNVTNTSIPAPMSYTPPQPRY